MTADLVVVGLRRRRRRGGDHGGGPRRVRGRPGEAGRRPAHPQRADVGRHGDGRRGRCSGRGVPGRLRRRHGAGGRQRGVGSRCARAPRLVGQGGRGRPAAAHRRCGAPGAARRRGDLRAPAGGRRRPPRPVRGRGAAVVGGPGRSRRRASAGDRALGVARAAPAARCGRGRRRRRDGGRLDGRGPPRAWSCAPAASSSTPGWSATTCAPTRSASTATPATRATGCAWPPRSAPSCGT